MMKKSSINYTDGIMRIVKSWLHLSIQQPWHHLFKKQIWLNLTEQKICFRGRERELLKTAFFDLHSLRWKPSLHSFFPLLIYDVVHLGFLCLSLRALSNELVMNILGLDSKLTCWAHTPARMRLVLLPPSLSLRMNCQGAARTQNCWNI